MPWLVGNEGSYRVLQMGTDASECLESSYLGYLSEGFADDLKAGRFRAERVSLGFRAGWEAIAVAARTDQPGLAKVLRPFLAPTAPRPHATAPLGFTLYSLALVRELLAPEPRVSRLSLQLAVRLQAATRSSRPVFCDPVLELTLTRRPEAESKSCRYRPAPFWMEAGQAVGWLLQGQPVEPARP
jgi:hypothetical protein